MVGISSLSTVRAEHECIYQKYIRSDLKNTPGKLEGAYWTHALVSNCSNSPYSQTYSRAWLNVSALYILNNHGHVPVRIRRGLWEVPQSRIWELFMNSPLDLGFVIDGVKTNNALKEYVKFWVALGISRHLEQRSENIYDTSHMRYQHLGGMWNELLLTMSSYVRIDPLALYTS